MPLPTPTAPLHILGCGSIGLLIASCIRRSIPAYPVSLLLRPHHRKRLIWDGRGHYVARTSLQSVEGDRFVVNVPAELIRRPTTSTNDAGESSDGSDTDEGPIRNLLLCTKAPDAVPALQSVSHRLVTSGSSSSSDAAAPNVVVLTNGALAVKDEIERDLLLSPTPSGGRGGGRSGGADDKCGAGVRLLLASITHGAHRGDTDKGSNENDANGDDGAYAVVHAGTGRVDIADDGFARLFTAVGLNGVRVASDRDMSEALWRKLAVNCVVNPFTALRDCKNGALLPLLLAGTGGGGGGGAVPPSGGGLDWHDPLFLDAILQEVSRVAIAENGSLPMLGHESLRSFVETVVGGTSSNVSSMLQDVRSRRHPTEVRYLNGYVARIGTERHGIACPANEAACDAVERLATSFVSQ